MILKEVSVERFAFTCAGCGNTWAADYDIQHVQDGYGHLRDYFFHNGLACPDPTAAGEAVCPVCGRTRIIVELTARRSSPAVTGATPAHPGVAVTPQRTAKRARIPLLPGTPIPWSSTAAPHDDNR